MHVLNSLHKFTCYLINLTASRIYKETFDLIFLKWTTRNVWSNIGNYCRSNLEQHAIFSFHQRHSETGWHNIIRSSPNFIPRKLCLYICRWNLPQPNRTKFTNVDVEVKNKMTHLYNTIKHATTSQASRSLLNFLLHAERQQASTFCRWSADHYYLSTSRAMVQNTRSSLTVTNVTLAGPLSFPSERFCRMRC
jgi:hypothetical protein